MPPAVIGFEDVLQGTALRSTVRAIEPTVCFRIAADDFMTMVSDNVLLAQSLFALLLANDRPRLPFAQPPRVLADHESPGAVHAAQAVAARSAAVARIGRTTARADGHRTGSAAEAGTVLFDVGTPPAVYQNRSGRGRPRTPWNEPGGRASGCHDRGRRHTGWNDVGWRATVSKDGRALRLERDELFSVLADHVDLMQGLFSGVLALAGHGDESG
jgi:hypothetical protein